MRYLQYIVSIIYVTMLVTGCQTTKDQDKLQAQHLVSELAQLRPNKNAIKLNNELIALGAAAVPAVIELFDSDNANAHVNAAWILGEIRDVRALPVLVEKGLNDPVALVREFSAQAIGSIGDPSAITHLEEVASKDVDPSVRETARSAIENIRSQMRRAKR